MAEKDPGTPDESSLELPSFGLRRRKRTRGTAPSVPATEPELTAEPAPEPPVVEDEPTVVLDEPPAVEDEPTVVIQPAPPAATTGATRAEVSAEHDTLLATDPPAAPEAAGPGTGEPETADPEDEDQHERHARLPGFVLPAVASMTAAVLTGLVIGLAMVGLTALSMRGCKAVNGTSSCGDPGLLLLLAILVTLAFAGGALLRAWNVADPGSTSVLAVGITTVIALLFLIEVLLDWWMVIVIPIVSMASYALAHWVTTAVADPAD